jgi:signal transduction histidine kinase
MSLFNTAVRKLALTYVCVLMVVSLSASFAMYKIADRQFESGLRRQQNEFINRLPQNRLLRELDDLRAREQGNARANLLFGLLIFNSIVLIGGGYFSYYSARSTLKPIQDAMDAQDRFTADASHELRTPLSAMKSEIEVALRDKKLSADEARQVLSSNLEEIDDLDKLTSGLLALARTPEHEIKLGKTELSKIIKSAQKQVEKSFSAKKVKIINHAGSRQYVMAEETTLNRLLVILLDNAVKYSRDGGKVEIKTESQKDKLKISIKDNGVGIKPSDLDNIFERFYRTDLSRTKNHTAKGYGLGLAIAKNIADQYDTKIDVSSIYDKGSEFGFMLRKVNQNGRIIVNGQEKPS